MILFTIECRVDSSVPHDLAALPIVSQPPRVSLHARVSFWKSLYIDFHKTEATRWVQWPTRRVHHLKPVYGKSARPESRKFDTTRRVIDPTRWLRFESAFSQNTKVVLNCVYFSEHFKSRQSELRFKIQDPSFQSLVPLHFPFEHVFVAENEIFKLIKHLWFIIWDKINIKY